MSTAFRIQMSGAEAIPGNASAATGLGVVIYDSAAGTAQYEVTVAGLDFGSVLGQPAQTAGSADDVTSMHVHDHAPGANGPVVFGPLGDADFSGVINPNGSTTFQGLWDAGDAGAGIGGYSAMLAAATPGTFASLYFDVHTVGVPGGEIRGQWVCIADDTANAVSGTLGDDILPGLGANDTINGFAGDDRLMGGDNRDRLTGGFGADRLEGGTGKDYLRGDAGREGGGDTLVGGGGKDRFIFETIRDSAPWGYDQIFDFNAGIGELIDVSAIDADPGTGGDQAFVIVAAFGDNPGEALFTYFSAPNVTALELDQDGDGVGDFLLVINGDQRSGAGFVL